MRNEDRLRDDRLKDKTQDQIMLPIGYTGSVWNWTPQTELTMAETSRLEGPVCELQHHWRGRGWGITSARRTSELIVDKKDCSRCAAEEEEGGIVSAPPLLALISSELIISTQYIMTQGNWNGWGPKGVDWCRGVRVGFGGG